MDSTLLTDLLVAGNYEQTNSLGRRALEQDPEDSVAHYCLGASYLANEDTQKAWPHIEFLLSEYPDESDSHVLATSYYMSTGDQRRASLHCDSGLQLDPERAVFYYYKASLAGQKLKIKEARRLIGRAIELDPDDPDYHHYAIQLDDYSNNSFTASWEKLERLKETLLLDPENASIHHSIGEVFLDDLRDPNQAEFHFRDALQFDPTNSTYQRSLFRAIAQKDLLYRLLSIPIRAIASVKNIVRLIVIRPWWILIILLLFKVVIVAAVWLLLATIVFLPAARIYQWLIIVEALQRIRGPIKSLNFMSWIHRWPMYVRMPFCIALILAVCSWALYLLQTPKSMVVSVVVFVLLHLLFVILELVYSKCRNWITRRSFVSKQRASKLQC